MLNYCYIEAALSKVQLECFVYIMGRREGEEKRQSASNQCYEQSESVKFIPDRNSDLLT